MWMTAVFIVQRLVGVITLGGAYFFMTAGNFWLGAIGFVMAIVGLIAIAGEVSVRQ